MERELGLQREQRGEVGIIRGVCSTTGRPCKVCTAMKDGQARRRCQYSYLDIAGHLQAAERNDPQNVEEDDADKKEIVVKKIEV